MPDRIDQKNDRELEPFLSGELGELLGFVVGDHPEIRVVALDLLVA